MVLVSIGYTMQTVYNLSLSFQIYTDYGQLRHFRTFSHTFIASVFANENLFDDFLEKNLKIWRLDDFMLPSFKRFQVVIEIPGLWFDPPQRESSLLQDFWPQLVGFIKESWGARMPAVVVASWIKHFLISNIACPIHFCTTFSPQICFFLLVASSVELCSNQQSLDLEATSPAAKLRPKFGSPTWPLPFAPMAAAPGGSAALCLGWNQHLKTPKVWLVPWSVPSRRFRS